LPNSTPQTWQVYPSFGGTVILQNSGGLITSTTVQHAQGYVFPLGLSGAGQPYNVLGGAMNCNKLVFKPFITATQTVVITFCLCVNYTNASIPEKYRYMFKPGYDVAHGFKIYWVADKLDGNTQYYRPSFVRANG
jgi:hypothetical protein